MEAIREDNDFVFKLLLLGNSGVGKSSLLLRFSDNTFTESYLATIGVDFKIKTLEIQEKTVKLQIWDTAGQERFKTLSSAYYKGADGIIIVYDITDRQSFKDIENWVTEIKKQVDENVVKLLIGNKVDLEGKRSVKKEEGEEMASILGFKFLETSAKDAFNVEKAFETIAEELKQQYSKKEAKVGDN